MPKLKKKIIILNQIKLDIFHMFYAKTGHVVNMTYPCSSFLLVKLMTHPGLAYICSVELLLCMLSI